MIKSDKWIKRQCEVNDFVYYITKDNVLVTEIFFNKDNYRDKLAKTSEYALNALTMFMTHAKPDEVMHFSGVSFKKLSNPTSNMITPFFPNSIKVDSTGKRIPSYGCSSYGYDVRIDRNFKLFKTTAYSSLAERGYGFGYDSTPEGIIYRHLPAYDGVIDVCNFNPDTYIEVNDVDYIVIPPHGFILGNTPEYIRVPRNVLVNCIGKSTLARCGLSVLVTPLEAGWEGHVTIEIINGTALPVMLKSGIGVSQLMFFEADEDCETSYADRGGKYQKQAARPIDPIV